MLQKALEESKREMESRGGVWNIGEWNITVGMMKSNRNIWGPAFFNQRPKLDQEPTNLKHYIDLTQILFLVFVVRLPSWTWWRFLQCPQICLPVTIIGEMLHARLQLTGAAQTPGTPWVSHNSNLNNRTRVLNKSSQLFSMYDTCIHTWMIHIIITSLFLEDRNLISVLCLVMC